DKKEREGRSVVEAMVHLNPEKQFGAHWCLLAGDAADELGLAQQATDAYLMVLQLQPAKPDSPCRSSSPCIARLTHSISGSGLSFVNLILRYLSWPTRTDHSLCHQPTTESRC
ncbi:MAG: hypothetical protein ACOVRM_13285, partial [Planctomycetaceae bacterium]